MQDPHPWPVGTKVIGQHFVFNRELNGAHGVIVGELKPRKTLSDGTGERRDNDMTYTVDWVGGDSDTAVEPKNLRRRIQRQPDRRSFEATGLKTILDLFKERETA